MTAYMPQAVTDKWSSPQHIIDEVVAEFGTINLDPAASHDNAVAPRYYTKEVNGLQLAWNADLVFVNPPYGRILNQWVAKALQEFDAGRAKTIVMLLPSRTCTRWFHSLYERDEVEIRFIRGRLKYGDGTSPAPFPSILVVIKNAEEVVEGQ